MTSVDKKQQASSVFKFYTIYFKTKKKKKKYYGSTLHRYFVHAIANKQ